MSKREGRGYAPRQGRIGWTMLWVVVLAIVLATSVYVLFYFFPHDQSGREVVQETVKTTLGVMAFIGAVLTGVYAYRKQRVAEGDAARADAQLYADRYNRALTELGSDQAAIRLGGVYSMASLADDWAEQRQACIDVLCAYLRMPYTTDTQSTDYKKGEKEVRSTILRVIASHVTIYPPRSTPTWCDAPLDFTGALFDSIVDFSGASFGSRITFSRCKFMAEVYFNQVVFNENVSFYEATFELQTKFGGSTFSGDANFSKSVFNYPLSMDHATFRGTVDFQECEFTTASFTHATFDQATLDCVLCKFDKLIFRHAIFGNDSDSYWSEATEGNTAIARSHQAFVGVQWGTGIHAFDSP